jgi:hypothetical protein
MGGPPMGGPPMGGPPGGFGGGPSKGGGGFLRSWAVASPVAVVAALIAAGVTFLLSFLPVAAMAGIGAGIALVLAIGIGLVGRAKMLHLIGMAGIGLVGGAIGGGAMWFLTHPGVYVDNASNEPINVYVDGEKIATVKADSHLLVNIDKGSHKLGWSPEGDKKPKKTVKAEIGMFKAHLYNPGKTACYWLVVDTYGAVSAAGKKDGPQPLEEFYVFDEVNNWFSENPEFVTVDKKSKGKTQTAVQRAKMCMQFKECGLKVREKLIECQQKAISADDESAFDSCGDKAAQSCKPGGGAPAGEGETEDAKAD